MIYSVQPKTPKKYYPTMTDILFDVEFRVPVGEDVKNSTKTSAHRGENYVVDFDVKRFISDLKDFVSRKENLYTVPRRSLYDSFTIPKKSGGLRRIDAPNLELSAALTELRDIFRISIGDYFHHTCAFAYVKDRCTVDAVKIHQKAESKWFAKFDFSNFFGSTTLNFVLEMCKIISPLNMVMEIPEGKAVLEKALELCFLDGGLPQGTQMSPFVTNMMMIPIDHQLLRYCGTHTPHLIYTRYADDICISCKSGFDFRDVEKNINKILSDFHAPFKIKPEKTHYGSNATSNWILGVMLNKENTITLGHTKKKHFKSKITHFIGDYKAGNYWSYEDAQKFLGEISYYRSVEKDYINYVIAHYNQKFTADIELWIKNIIKGELPVAPDVLTF